MVKLIQQMIKFGFVGVLCFFIDYGIMVFLTEVFGINYMVSSTVSFSVSVTVNYILSVAFVFETDKDKNKIKEFIVFVLLYVPCVAAVSTIRKEMNSRNWTLVSIGWQLLCAYALSFAVYQVGCLLGF